MAVLLHNGLPQYVDAFYPPAHLPAHLSVVALVPKHLLLYHPAPPSMIPTPVTHDNTSVSSVESCESDECSVASASNESPPLSQPPSSVLFEQISKSKLKKI